MEVERRIYEADVQEIGIDEGKEDGFDELLRKYAYDNDELSNAKSSVYERELKILKNLFQKIKVYQLVNHGMSSELLDKIRELSKEFFKLPLEKKERKYSSKGDSLEGYGNDNTIRQGNFNWNDKLHLQVHPEHMRQLEFWPKTPQQFRTTLHEYSNKTKEVSKTLFKAISRSLKLDENRFFELWGDDKEYIIHARFNFYPRCPSANQVVGQWFRVPIIPEAIIIHVGDQLEIASNGIFKSPVHKVVINPKCERISLAMLPLPNPEKEIGPLKELITEDRPQMLILQIARMASMERQIDAVKINY